MALLILIILLIASGIIIYFVTSIQSENPSRLLQEAEAARQRGNLEEAIEILEKVLQIDPYSVNARWMLADIQRKKGNTEMAIKYLREILQMGTFPPGIDELKIRKRLATYYKELGNLASAYHQYAEIAKIDPDDVESRIEMGKILFQRGMYEKALIEFKFILERKPDYPDALFYTAVIHYKMELFKTAREEFKRLLSVAPSYTKAHYYLGMIYLKEGNYQKAVNYLEEAISESEIQVEAYKGLGEACFNLQIWDKARDAFERVLRFFREQDIPEEDCLDIYYKLGVCYENLGNIKKAVEMWEKVYNYDPAYADVEIRLESYKNLAEDDPIRDFLLTPASQIEKKTREIVRKMGYKVKSSKLYNPDEVDVTATDDKEDLHLFSFKRWIHPVGDMVVKEVRTKMLDLEAIKAHIFTCGDFTRSAVEYAESRQIELYPRDAFREILRTVTAAQKPSDSVSSPRKENA